ncbi:MAG TPA: OmpA family protein [Aequorivita sp.]|nr:OmpA family protein [Aequorivita sp.]
MSQNLVLNPSFEISTKDCAEAIGDMERHTLNWSTPSLGSSDIFNPCSSGRTDVPYNFVGHQIAQFGEKYAGGYFFHAERNYREYFQGKFSSSLEKGKKYRVSFYISLGEISDFAIKNIGFLISEKGIRIKTTKELTSGKLINAGVENFSLFSVESDGFYDNKNDWVLVTKDIVAKGNENYISIGNFQPKRNVQTKMISSDRGSNKAYYFLDMVSVEPLETEPKAISGYPPAPELISDPTVMEFDKTYIFDNIMFDFDSIELEQPAKDQILSIYEFLRDNPNIHLFIAGHTDNVGSSTFNQRLSENRSKAVAQYLEELGLEKIRLNLAAFGFTAPVTSNETDQGRSLNRRVEFRITKGAPVSE